MTREELIGLLSATANFMDDREEMIAYIDTLKAGEGLSEKEIREGYEVFKTEKFAGQLAQTAQKHGLEMEVLQTFVDSIMDRMIFDGEHLSDLLAPLDLGWKERTKKELALMDDLMPLLKKLAQGRDISGLGAYEN
jgi:type I restriction enzyme R subunit